MNGLTALHHTAKGFSAYETNLWHCQETEDEFKVMQHYVDTVKVLIQAGAPAQDKTNGGEAPLDLATYSACSPHSGGRGREEVNNHPK